MRLVRLALPLLHGTPCAAPGGAATQGNKIGGSARGQDTHAMLAASPRFATGAGAQKCKKRGKCEIVPLFDGRVLFFAYPLSPHPLPRPSPQVERGANCTLPLGGRVGKREQRGRWREARGHSLHHEGERKKRKAAHPSIALAPLGERVGVRGTPTAKKAPRLEPRCAHPLSPLRGTLAHNWERG
jgi:hypothetical protein